MKLVNKLLLPILSVILEKNKYFRGKFRLVKFYNKNIGRDIIKRAEVIDNIFIDVNLRVYNESLYYFKLEEYEELELLKYICKEHLNFADCGSNQGVWSLIASRNLRENGHVYSFEPDPGVNKKQLNNIKINNCANITLYDFALSSEEGETYFELYQDHVINHLTDQKTKNSIPIKVKTIDGVFNDKSLDFIKIDVEGYELEVLKGAINTLKQNHDIKLVIEFNPWILGYEKIGLWPVYQFLHVLGFKVLHFNSIADFDKSQYLNEDSVFKQCVNVYASR